MKDPAYIQQLFTKGKEAGEKARLAFTTLSAEQLNWKPSAESWSIGQCLDHLIVADCKYFPAFQKIVSGKYDMNFWENWSPLGGLFGKILVHHVKEKPVRNLRAPKVFAPSKSKIDTGILERFHKHLDSLLGYIIECRSIDLDKVHISSPVSKWVTYSLRNAFTLLIQHEHRHINQAIRVKETKGYELI